MSLLNEIPPLAACEPPPIHKLLVEADIPPASQSEIDIPQDPPHKRSDREIIRVLSILDSLERGNG